MLSELSGWVALAMAMRVGLEVIPFLPIVKAMLAEIGAVASAPLQKYYMYVQLPG